MEQGAKRIWQMDALRGLALLNMLVYHGMYDWVYVFGHPSRWYDIGSAGCHVWQQYICWSFILLSGASFCLGRRQLKNGLLTAGCALILTAVTALVMPSELILFGVLHFNACAVLLTCLLRPVLETSCPGAIWALRSCIWLRRCRRRSTGPISSGWACPISPGLPRRIISPFCPGCFCSGAVISAGAG